MSDKQEQPSPPASEATASGDAEKQTSPKKPYKSPTVSRHGNLRLMTQLE